MVVIFIIYYFSKNFTIEKILATTDCDNSKPRHDARYVMIFWSTGTATTTVIFIHDCDGP